MPSRFVTGVKRLPVGAKRQAAHVATHRAAVTLALDRRQRITPAVRARSKRNQGVVVIRHSRIIARYVARVGVRRQ